MGKAQANFFVIIGIILVIMVATFLTLRRVQNEDAIKGQSELSDVSFVNFQSYFDQCTRTMVVRANIEIGMNENDKQSYESYLTSQIKSCMADPYESMKNQGYKFIDAQLSAIVEYEDNTLIIKVSYPVETEKNNKKFTLMPIEFTFDKGQFEDLDETQELSIVSSDNRANIKVPVGTNVEFEDGTLIDSVGIKVIEKNFDGLNNGIVVGNLVYEGLPDGATFSKPVEIAIRFNVNDVPDNSDVESLSIAWWDEDLKIWRGLETNIENGVATARTDHFTKFAIVTGCSGEPKKNEVVVMTPYLFKQKYEMIQPEKGPSETDEMYSARMNILNKFYCEGSASDGMGGISDLYWLNDNIASIPSKAAYLLTLDNLPGGIRESVQEVEESFIFGDDPDMCSSEAKIWERCCCKGSTQGCDPNPISFQDCVGKYREDAFPLLTDIMEGGICPAIVADFEGSVAEAFEKAKYNANGWPGSKELNEMILGYNEKSCVGGKTVDADGDGKIIEIEFHHNGDSCLAPLDAISIDTYYNDILDENGDCYLNPDAVTRLMIETPIDRFFSKEPFDIVFEEATVKSPSRSFTTPGFNYCATCRAAITIRGTGVTAKGSMVCETEGETLVVGGQCMTCKLDSVTGLVLASENGGDCSCTRQMLGTAFCDTFKWCTLVDNVPKLIDWTPKNNECTKCLDPLTKQSDPDCFMAVYPNEVK